MKKLKFRLMTSDGHGNKTGPHCMGTSKDGTRIILRAGDVIETDQPLDKLFRNKFERIDSGITPEQKIEDEKPKKKNR